jgi:uncharacterized protein (DUF433 family)
MILLPPGRSYSASSGPTPPQTQALVLVSANTNRPRQREPLSRRLSPESIAELVATHEAGTTSRDLAKRYKISKTSVLAILHDNGIPVRAQRRMTDHEVDEAVAKYEAGWSLAKLGQHFDIDDETVRGRLLRRGPDAGSSRPARSRRIPISNQ